ncbi:MAG TPA: hypothetical protein VFU81_17175, partial [Thermomicrobiales bacterium]|nr:hypothetical protein [Thermomicrobiales bacterium]
KWDGMQGYRFDALTRTLHSRRASAQSLAEIGAGLALTRRVEAAPARCLFSGQRLRSGQPLGLLQSGLREAQA